MEKKYQKEVKISLMFKTLAKRWLALLMTFIIALTAGAAIGFFTTFKKKVYGTNLDFYFYQIPTTDNYGNTVIGTAVEYDEKTLNMIFQNLTSQSFIEAIFCENGIPVKEEGMSDELVKAIDLATEKVEELEKARAVYAEKTLELALVTKTTITARAAFEAEKEAYNTSSEEYMSALQANATAIGSGGQPIVSEEDMGVLADALGAQKESYNTAKTAYENALKAEETAERAFATSKQAIATLNKEASALKNDAMMLLRNKGSYKEEMKRIADCISISYADKTAVNKATIRVSIAVKNDEDLAKKLIEKVQEQLPIYIIEKIDYNTAYCDQINVFAEVEQVNKNETLKSTILFGIIGGFFATLVACCVILVIDKQKYIVLVPYETEE